jgi:hypothetical protein
MLDDRPTTGLEKQLLKEDNFHHNEDHFRPKSRDSKAEN